MRTYDQSFGFELPAWMEALGIFFMIVGFILVIACGAVFVIRGRGTPAPFDPPKTFVVLGPYKYVRNPMYVGGFILIMGFGLYLHSLSVLLLSLFLALLIHIFVLFVEEPVLEKRFGRNYLDYKKSVNRWLLKL